MTAKTDQPHPFAHDADTLQALRALPTRAPVAPAAPVEPVQWELVDLDRYVVRVEGRTVGFIDVVGAVFVAMHGARYDRAIEVEQTLSFEHALSILAPR